MVRVLSAIGPLAPDAGGDLLAQAGVEAYDPGFKRGTSAAELIEALRGCVATIAGSEPYTHEVFAAVPELRHVARLGVGYDAVDLDAAREAGVALSTTPDTLNDAVADLTFALMLDVARGISRHDRAMRGGDWSPIRTVDVSRKTLGIIGLGRIGRAVAQRAGGFGMHVLANEPLPDTAFVERHGIELVPLDDLLRRADFVSLHLPLSAATRRFFDAELLQSMRSDAFLINTARGGLIDEDALEEALRTGQIAGAALDVRDVEPPNDNRFAQFDNVVLTPHIASNTLETRRAMSLMSAENVLRVLRGERPHGFINPEVWDRVAGRQAQ